MEQKVRKQLWNWFPKFPIDNNSLFYWPLHIKTVIKLYASMWFSFSETFIRLISVTITILRKFKYSILLSLIILSERRKLFAYFLKNNSSLFISYLYILKKIFI